MPAVDRRLEHAERVSHYRGNDLKHKVMTRRIFLPTATEDLGTWVRLHVQITAETPNWLGGRWKYISTTTSLLYGILQTRGLRAKYSGSTVQERDMTFSYLRDCRDRYVWNGEERIND